MCVCVCVFAFSRLLADDFKWAIMNTVGNNVSPLEVDVIFNIFDTNRDGRIALHDFQCVVHYGRACTPEEVMCH